MPRLYVDNFEVTLTDAIATSVDTAIVLPTGTGSQLSALALSPANFLTLTISNGSAIEIVYAIDRVADTLTVIRGREGTSATPFAAGSVVGCYLTATALRRLERPRKLSTISFATALFHEAPFSITDSDAVVGDRVVMQFEPNTDFDIDDLLDLQVIATISESGTITGVISRSGPLVGDYLLSYSLE